MTSIQTISGVDSVNSEVHHDHHHALPKTEQAESSDIILKNFIDVKPGDDLEENIKPCENKADIEHAGVEDDPRLWSKFRKAMILVVVSSAAMVAGLGANIYNPAISEIEQELHTTSAQISLTLALFILIQGGFPLLWSAASEVVGRKKVYLISLTVCTAGCAVAGTSKSISVLIGMRCLQAAGSSAVITIGAATLADIYEPHERGTMVGIFYCAPLLGPSLGPILGGALTQSFSWRATFYFLAIFTGICFLAFIPFQDTFRRERSLTYQLVLKRVKEEKERERAGRKSEASSVSGVTAVSREVYANDEKGEREGKVEAKAEGKAEERHEVFGGTGQKVHFQDLEEHDEPRLLEVKLSLKDMNPIAPILAVLRRPNNLIILFGSGLIFAFSYCITYTCSRTLADEYHFNALKIGLVLLSFGIGSMFGSVLGGRWSDRAYARLKERNGGVTYPEMRLESTRWFMPFFPAFVIAYGWVCEKRVNVAAICVFLFMSGFFSIAIYSSTLAYIVDANTGRSSSAVATNSFFRGLFAFVASEVAVPLQLGIGDGGMYSLWAGIMLVSEACILAVWWRGSMWREKAIRWESRQT